MTASFSFRYSTGKVATSENAKSFPWEKPVPINRFWDSFEYGTARSFLTLFTDSELAQLTAIDPHSTADHQTKLHLLLRLLREKLAQEVVATTPPQSQSEAEHKRWYALNTGIYAMQRSLDLPEAEQTVRMLAAREAANTDNLVPRHMLASYLVEHDGYEEAERTEQPVLAWMEAHPNLGRDSPQAINARRIIIQALWRQGSGRRAEAEAMLADLKEIVDGMGEGKFGVYQEEERMLNEAMFRKLGD